MTHHLSNSPLSVDGTSETQVTKKDPIAIIGIGCRFPGRINSPETFWQLLLDKVDAITEIPTNRFDVEALYDPALATPGKIITRAGGFLDQVDQFDAKFFGISPREAERLDPQQRLLLEVAWEALADAGQVVEPPSYGTAAPAQADELDENDDLLTKQTGVFIGLWLNDYEMRTFVDPSTVDLYSSTGCGPYSASGRISYSLGLQGPSVTINTHCSSSLVAVHLGCQSLWSGESDLVLAGGANIILQPHISVAYSQSRLLSPDGRCKFGDIRANGYVRSEGAGLVVLKRLSQAVADGDSIYAVIQGSAVNNDGRSSGFLTTPSRQGQVTLLRRAYRDAGIAPGQVQYVEAHGTGTQVGDRVELEALGAVMGAGRPANQTCLVGSVKTNIGHTEATAGIAGLIKVALMLKHRTIPANLHLQQPNPNIAWHKLGLAIPAEALPWLENMGTAMAGVSSFGITGTNAHVVLSEAPSLVIGEEFKENKTTSEIARAYLLPLSAHTPKALEALVGAYKTWLTTEPTASLTDVCYTASCHTTHLSNRLALVVESRQELANYLDELLQDETGELEAFDTNSPIDLQRKGGHKVVFVFPGQGSQWPAMGRQLLEREPVFRETLDQCEQAMQSFVDWSLLEQLAADEASPNYRLNEIDVIQPTLLCIEIALAALWRSWGIEADAIIGHSMGEVAAAYVAGALTLEDAMRVICYRSQLMRRKSGQGAMALVELSIEAAQAALAGYEDRVSIAASNSPYSTVLSGDPAALSAIVETLKQQDIFCRLINVDVAAHSPQMEPLLDELLTLLDGLRPQTAVVPIYSTSLGRVIDGSQHDASYWVQNMRQPVLLSPMVQQLLAEEHNIFIEMSPHPILLSAIERGFQYAGRNGATLPSLRRNEAEQTAIFNSLGALYTLGYPVDWPRLYVTGGRRVKLPAYPWQRERFWLDGTPSATTNQNRTESVSDANQDPNASRQPKTSRQPDNIRATLLAVEPGRRRRSLLETHLREQIAKVLKLAPARIPLDEPVKTLGMDSLMTLELKNRLDASLGLSLPTTILWNYPTIAALTPYLADQMDIPLEASKEKKVVHKESLATGDAPSSDETISTELESVSKDDVEALLAKELAAIDDLLKGEL